MALIDKASLLMVPSTYEAGKLYNVLPSGNRAPDSTDQNSGYDQTRADFDFDRGSNAAATRVNASGLIEKGRENVLLQSNQFDTTWASYAATETGGQIGYDGTSNAWLLDKSAASGNVYQDVSISGVNTYSVYVKGGTNTWVALLVAGPNAGKFFNLSGSGAVGSNFVNAPVGASIESIGSGWFRISIITNASVTQVRIYPAESDGVNSGTSGNIYIQNAQVEKGLVASSYLDSTSVTGKAGVLVDLPRINYDANGENGALLLEPSRVNSLPHSEYFGDSSWSKSGMTLTTNTSDTKSPEGVYNAAHVEATNTDPYLLAFPSVTTGDVTFSIYIKAIGDAVGRACSIHLDYNFGTATGTNATQGFNAPSDWTRFDVTGNCSASGTVRVRAELGNAATIGDDFYIYGAQVESSASYPSSYIPTMGTSETRAADSCSVTGVSDVIGQTEGTLFAEIEKFENGYWYLTISDGGSSNWIFIGEDLGKLRGYVRTSGGVQTDNRTADLSVGVHKMAIAYKTNDVAIYLDGTQVFTDSSANMPSTLNKISLTSAAAGVPANQTLKAELKQYALFKERLSNAELAALTA